MATIKWPRGRRKTPLVTPYEVGDRVRFVYFRGGAEAVEAEIAEGNTMPRLGEVGTIRRVYIAEPNDGDQTFLMLDVRWDALGTRWPVGENEIEDEEAWLRRQLGALTGVTS